MSIFLFLSLGFAQEPCDANELSKVIETSTGDTAAEAFTSLASCEPSKALQFAKTTFPTIIPSEAGYSAALAGIKIGADEFIVEWMNTTLEPDEQKRALRMFGDECASDKNIQQFFISTAENSPDKFWSKRYYQYLTSCKTKSIQDILEVKMKEGTAQGRSQFFAVTSAYARNLEGSSLPLLVEFLNGSTDGEVQTNMIAAMYEAIDETTKRYAEDKKKIAELQSQTKEAIVTAAPNLEPNALNQARITLNAIGFEGESDGLAKHVYKRKKQQDESFLWGAVVVENAVCKKGKKKQRIQALPIAEQGNTWADQFESRSKDAIEHAISIDLAKSCKAEDDGEVLFVVPTEPFANMDEYKVWSDTVKKEHKDSEIKKVSIVDHNLISM